MSLLKKTQDVPKAYWIITALAIVIGIIVAVIIPVPRLYKWSVFFIVFLVLTAGGVFIYSWWKGKSSGMGRRNNTRRRGRR